MGKLATRAAVVALVAALAAGVLYARSRSAGLFDRVVADEDRYYLPPPGWLRAFSLGYNEAVADLVWVKTIVYFGERAVFAKRRSQVDDLPDDLAAAQHTVNYLAVVTALDPRFRSAYSDGARLTMYHKGRITRRTVEMAIELLEQGLAQYPDDGEIAFTLGFLNYFELEPFLAAGSKELAEIREKGVRLIRASATMADAPQYVSVMSSSLLRREGLDELVVEHLRALLVKETDPGIRRTLEAQLRRALGRTAERDIAATDALARRWRDEMPFVPFDLFLLLEPSAAADVRHVLDPTAYAADDFDDEPETGEPAPEAGAEPGDGPGEGPQEWP